MSQVKLPATAVFSRIFLGRSVSMSRTFALVTIFCGSLGTAAYGQMQNAAEASQDSSLSTVPLFIYAMATLALLFESCLSAGTGVFLQWVFVDMDALWVRNAQFSVLSIVQYIVLHYMKDGDTCTTSMDGRGALVGVLYAMMGVSVALTVLWLGAIEKTVASVSSIVITTVCDHLFILQSLPTLLEVVLAGVIINGIVHFSLAN
jgi:hypothetical protein